VTFFVFPHPEIKAGVLGGTPVSRETMLLTVVVKATSGSTCSTNLKLRVFQMMPLLDSIIKFGILLWFFPALRLTCLLYLFSAEMKVFNPFFKISGQKIIFINLNNFFGYCSF
jgi:hypothetical protein